MDEYEHRMERGSMERTADGCWRTRLLSRNTQFVGRDVMPGMALEKRMGDAAILRLAIAVVAAKAPLRVKPSVLQKVAFIAPSSTPEHPVRSYI